MVIHNRHPAHLKYPKANQRPSLIKNFLDVQIIKNACFWQCRKFQIFLCTCSKVIDEKYKQSVCSSVCYFAVNNPLFFRYCISFRSRSRHDFYGSGSGSEQTVSAAPAPAPAPTKMVSAPAAPAPAPAPAPHPCQ